MFLVASLYIVDIEIVSMLVYLITSGMYFYSGLSVYKNTKTIGFGGRIAGVALMAWGIHKLDYPFIENYQSFIPVGYQISIFLTLTTAIGIILLHFEKVKSTLAGREDIFKNFANASKDISFVVSYYQDQKLEYASPSIKDVLGYSFYEIKENFLLYDYIFRNGLLFNISKSSNQKGTINVNDECSMMLDGKNFTFNISAAVTYGFDGKPERVVGFARDITEQVLEFDKILDRKDWYEGLFIKSKIMMMIVDTETGKIVDANPALSDFYKYSQSEFKGMDVDVLFKDMSKSEIKERIDNPQEHVNTYQNITSDGSVVDVAMYSVNLDFGDKDYAYIIVLDLTSERFLERELAVIKNFHSAILDSLSEGVVGLDSSGKVYFANKFALDSLGFTQDELIGKEHHSTIHWRETTHEDCCILNALHRGEELKNHRDYFSTKSGEILPIEMNLGVLERDFDEVKGVIVFRNIKAKLEAENKIIQQLHENKTLLQEVHHRVKNNLQVICSLLALKAESIDDENGRNLLNDSASRIKSMALIHELLYQSEGLNVVSFKDYAERLISDINVLMAYGNNVSISCDIEDYKISLDEAVPYGLIVTELITNSIKHAFDDGMDDREVWVEFKLNGHRKELVIRDNGRGVEDIQGMYFTNSFGLNIVNSLIKQIGAEIFYENDNGLKCVISI
jgi:PAS domain S-box-containing protein